MTTIVACQHFNAFVHVEAGQHHYGEKSGINQVRTALIQWISCGVRDGDRIVLDGSFAYALDRSNWQELTDPAPADRRLLRTLAMARVDGDVEALLDDEDLPWFKPFRGTDRVDAALKYLSP